MVCSVKNKNEHLDGLISEDWKEAKLMQQETDIIEEWLKLKLAEIFKFHEEQKLIMKTYEWEIERTTAYLARFGISPCTSPWKCHEEEK